MVGSTSTSDRKGEPAATGDAALPTAALLVAGPSGAREVARGGASNGRNAEEEGDRAVAKAMLHSEGRASRSCSSSSSSRESTVAATRIMSPDGSDCTPENGLKRRKVGEDT